MFEGDLWVLASAAVQLAPTAYKTGPADEREACEKVCEAERRLGIDDERAYYGDLMAAAIRARSNT